MQWWARTHVLAMLVPHTPGAGKLLREALDRPDRWPRPRPAEIAWIVAPLCRDGHLARSRALRAEITDDPLAAWIADLALAAFGSAAELRDDSIARILGHLADVIGHAAAAGDRAHTKSVGDALAHALDWLVPLGCTHQLLAVAASLPAHHGLSFARLLQTRGLEQNVREQITPTRISELARGDWLLRSGLAAACWAPLVTPARAGELWALAWRPATDYAGQATMAPQRAGALQFLVEWLPLALRAGDATTPTRLAELALEIGDWFP